MPDRLDVGDARERHLLVARARGEEDVLREGDEPRLGRQHARRVAHADRHVVVLREWHVKALAQRGDHLGALGVLASLAVREVALHEHLRALQRADDVELVHLRRELPRERFVDV